MESNTPKGESVNEKGVDNNGRILVEIDKHYFRPTEVDYLIGDADALLQTFEKSGF